MKICICTTGPDLNSQVSPIFGRCPYFLIVETENKKFKAISNSSSQPGRGAGVAGSQVIVSEGIKAVFCGNFGPNAFSVLEMSGIKIYSVALELTAADVLDKYSKGELNEIKTPSSSFGHEKRFGRRNERHI